MTVDNMLKSIGFSNEEQLKYKKYKGLIGDKISPVAQSYMYSQISFEEALEEIHKINHPNIHQYTIDLLFTLSCSPFLLEKYNKKGISEKYFLDAMKDIKYKLDECITVKNVFGIFVINWYRGFLEMQRFAFGRLQYNITKHSGETFNIKGYKITEGDFLLECHIPSAGPLKPELCMDSYKEAYEFFKKYLKDSILPIRCTSWLLYPPYLSLFGESSNTADFAKSFEITEILPKDKLTEDWRIFGMEYDGDIKKLPSCTRLQKGFIDYIEKVKPFGTACGYLLFNGKEILTR